MSQKIYSNLDIKGNAKIGDITNATSDTDKFLVSDAGVVKYRTGSEMLSDLGVAPGVASNIQHQVKAGVAISKGQAVYVTGADGTNMIVGLASNTSEATSSKTMGLMASTVATNGFGNVIAEGLLAGLNTSTANAGDPVWLGTGGNLIYGLINKPYAPNHLVFIGIVTRSNANNGEIFVKVQNGFELNEIHDADLKTNIPVNGDILGFNGTLWVNKTIAAWLGYTPVSQARTLTINGTSYDLSADRSWSIAAGVTSFNTRTGAITLTSGDVTGALGYTPYNSSNPNGYISSYTETDPTVPSYVKSITATEKSNWNTAFSWGNHALAGYATSGHTHDLGRYSLRAPALIDSVTASNFRTQLFGSSTSGYNISTARFNTTPGLLSGLNNYGTMMAWSGSDTHGFLAIDYAGAGAIVGGGNADNINWTKRLAFLDDTVPNNRTITINGTSYDLSANRSWTVTASETDTLATVTARGNTTTGDININGKIRVGSFPNSTTNNGEAWIGRAADRSAGTMTVQLGGNLDRKFEVVDYGWTTVNFQVNGYGAAEASGSMRAPIFYDSDNTAYYFDGTGGTRQSKYLTISGGGSGNNGNELVVGNTTVQYSLQDTNLRPIIQATGAYPVLTLNHTVTSNGSHGGTVQFTSNGVGNQFVIGSSGNGSQLDIGTSSNTTWNPHNGIAGYQGTTGWRMDTSGNINNLVSNRAPIFYDYNDTGYYWNPATDTSHRFQTPSGYIDIGPKNGSYCHIYTDRGSFYFNAQLEVLGNRVLNAGNYSNYAWPIEGGWKPASLASSTRLRGATSPDGGEFALAYSGGQIHAYTDGFFYQNEGQYRVIDSSSIASQSVNYANSSGSASYLPTAYAGGQQLNPQVYFNNGIGLKAAMTAKVGYWSDTLWINGYSGGDVPWMCALHTQRNSSPRMYISAQQSTSGSYGTAYEFLTEYNYNDYVMGLSSAQDVTGIKYFRTNNGGYCGSLSSGTLQAYSNSNNSAYMSFHKGGHYAVNMGLDADNVLRIGGWSASANRWQLDMSGNMTVSGDVTAYSDIRVKENINTINNALDKVLSLRGVTYNRIDSEDKSEKIGVIAQEIQEVLPQVVHEQADGMLGVSYGNITAVLIEAIKEQQNQIEELKKLVNQLTNK